MNNKKDNLDDIKFFIEEHKRFITEEKERAHAEELFNSSKEELNNLSSHYAITYNPIDFDMKNNILKWSGTLSNNVEWYFSYGEGDTGLHITTNMLKIDNELLKVLSKINGYFMEIFAKNLKTDL